MKAIISLVLSLAVVGLSAVRMLVQPVVHSNPHVMALKPKPKENPAVHHTSPILPVVANLPNMGKGSLDSMASQGILYGLAGTNSEGKPRVILFISRAPNAPTDLTIQHWPSLRFAPVAAGSHLSRLLGPGFGSKIHWVAINPALLVK